MQTKESCALLPFPKVRNSLWEFQQSKSVGKKKKYAKCIEYFRDLFFSQMSQRYLQKQSHLLLCPQVKMVLNLPSLDQSFFVHHVVQRIFKCFFFYILESGFILLVLGWMTSDTILSVTVGRTLGQISSNF